MTIASAAALHYVRQRLVIADHDAHSPRMPRGCGMQRALQPRIAGAEHRDLDAGGHDQVDHGGKTRPCPSARSAG